MNDASGTAWLLGDWSVQPSANELIHRSGRRVRIEARAMAVLELLHQNAGQVVTTDEMLARVWEGKVVSPHSVATVISSLRRSLAEDSTLEYIETIPKRGYRLVTRAPGASRSVPTRRIPGPRSMLLAGALVALAVGLLLWSGRAHSPIRGSPAVESSEMAQYLRARQLWSRREHDATLEARRLLTELIATRDDFAPAHAALADIYAHKSGEDLGLPELDTYREAQRELDRARALDPALPEPDVTQALLDFYRDHQARKALASVDRALAKDARFAYAWQTRAMVLSAVGEHEASIEAIDRARALDPASDSIGWDRVWFLYLARNFEAARNAYDEQSGRAAPIYLYGALIALARNNDAAALELWMKRCVDREFALADRAAIEDLAARADWPGAYASLAAQVGAIQDDREQRPIIALWQLLAHEREQSIATLTSGDAERRDWLYLWLAEMPAFDAIVREPRVQARLGRIGIARTDVAITAR